VRPPRARSACAAPRGSSGSRRRPGRGRCVSIVFDKNRRHIGKSQSKQDCQAGRNGRRTAENDLATGTCLLTPFHCVACFVVPPIAPATSLLRESHDPLVTPAVQTAQSLSRGGSQNRRHSLVNCDHGDSTTSRLDSPLGSAGAVDGRARCSYGLYLSISTWSLSPAGTPITDRCEAIRRCVNE
jgi:hypothetical protein